jgi:hypothetical protein
MFRKKNKFFQDLDYLTSQEVEDNKINFEKLARVSPYFEKDKTLAYSIILNQREDIDPDTKKYLETLINKNKEEEDKKLKRYLDIMESKNYNNEVGN